MDHFEHLLDNFFQNFCLFADDVLCNHLPKRQNALQPIQECRWHLVVSVLFLQELNSQALAVVLTREQRTRTSNVTLARPKTAFATGFN